MVGINRDDIDTHNGIERDIEEYIDIIFTGYEKARGNIVMMHKRMPYHRGEKRFGDF